MKCYCIKLVNGWSLRCCDVKLDKIRHDSYTMTFCQKHDSSSPLFFLCFFLSCGALKVINKQRPQLHLFHTKYS